MGGLISLIQRNRTAKNPPELPKTSSPLRFGVLGAARIVPEALILPARTHPDVVVLAVAARDKTRAETFAKKWGVKKAYGGYQALLDDPEIDVVYNPLPNGLHFEWSMKALAAGKHVLLEKPSVNTADEARRLWAYAKEKNLVLLEAFHYRFHPAVHRFKEILESGELGKIKSIDAKLAVPKGMVLEKDDIRLHYSLGGGCMMDMGVYTLSAIRFLSSSEPISVLSASKTLCSTDALVDTATSAQLDMGNDIIGSLKCDYLLPPHFFGIIPHFPEVVINVECEGGLGRLFQFVQPMIYHYIQVRPKKGVGESKGKERTEKVYKYKDGFGEEYWTTYRYMLEAFVDRVRGREPRYWLDEVDAVRQAEAVDMVYEKNGLPLRPNSTFSV